jgi:lipid II:glycine glycyltransferase (peptidoglycan interpeptide bridge formation enzyme)
VEDEKYVAEFLRLIRLTEKRKKIKFHEDKYYQKMLETLPEGMRRLYVAEYKHKIIAANLMIFFEDTAIYLHGATDDEYRNQMAPYLLQWQAILDAQKAGCKFYDFGGVKTEKENNAWSGITKFKLGFFPKTKPVEFPGSYDIIVNPIKYWLYRGLQKLKKMVRKYA